MSPADEFKWALQALAQPAAVQPALFPPFVVVADELALEFDNWRRAAEWQAEVPWSAEQRQAVAELDRALTGMSDPGQPELWSDAGRLSHPMWGKVRGLARAVLSAFGWSPDVPPADRGGGYVPG